MSLLVTIIALPLEYSATKLYISPPISTALTLKKMFQNRGSTSNPTRLFRAKYLDKKLQKLSASVNRMRMKPALDSEALSMKMFKRSSSR